MKLLQTYYTSCRIGQSGASGFQFYSYSEGLTQEELYEIEKIGNYIAPLNLPSNPSTEDIETKFPISFNYFILKSGRVGVLQSVALTQDYSGRPGNFLSHAYILESGVFPFAPILLYKSNSFRTNLSSEEWNITNIPSKLPCIELESLEKNANISLKAVQSFLDENNNENIYSEIINAIIEHPTSNRKIVIADEQINIAFWIASISFSFPLHLTNNITFSSYSLDPTNNNALVCGSSQDGGRFNFSNDDLYQFQYYIFNIPLKKFSSVNHSSIYAEITNTALSISYDRLLTLHNFFGNFNYQQINDEIDLIYKLFSLSEKKGELEEDWLKLLEFIGKYAKDDYLNGFLSSHFENFLDKVLGNISSDDSTISEFFEHSLSILRRTKKTSDFEVNFNLYISWLNMRIFCLEGENPDFNYIDKLLLTNKLIVNKLLAFGRYFEEYFFSNENFNLFYNYLSDNNTNSFAGSFISITAENSKLSKCNFENTFKILSFNLIIDLYTEQTSLEKSVDLLFSSITDADTYSILLDKLSLKLSTDILLSSIQKVNKNIINSEVLLNFIEKSGNIKLQIELTPYFLSGVSDPVNYFWSLIEHIASIKISSEEYCFIIESYTQSRKLEKSEIKKIIQLSTKKGCTTLLPKLIEAYEQTLSFEEKDKRDTNFVAELCCLKKKQKIQTTENICELYILLKDLEEGKFKTVLSVLKKVDSDLNQLTQNKCNLFVSDLFKHLIPLISKEKDFFFIFLLISKTNKFENLLEELKKELIKQNKIDKNDNITYLLLFYFDFEQYKSNLGSTWEQTIEEFVIDILSKEDDSSLEVLDAYFRTKKNDKLKKWEALIPKVAEQKENKISKKINKLFNSLFKK